MKRVNKIQQRLQINTTSVPRHYESEDLHFTVIAPRPLELWMEGHLVGYV